MCGIKSETICKLAGHSLELVRFFWVDVFLEMPQVSCCTGTFWTRAVIFLSLYISFKTVNFFQIPINLKEFSGKVNFVSRKGTYARTSGKTVVPKLMVI